MSDTKPPRQDGILSDATIEAAFVLGIASLVLLTNFTGRGRLWDKIRQSSHSLDRPLGAVSQSPTLGDAVQSARRS